MKNVLLLVIGITVLFSITPMIYTMDISDKKNKISQVLSIFLTCQNARSSATPNPVCYNTCVQNLKPLDANDAVHICQQHIKRTSVLPPENWNMSQNAR